jgi:hypothetical protein
MNYSGASPAAMYAREREQFQTYEEASGSFQYLLNDVETNAPELAEWFGNGGVIDYGPIFVALVAAREQGCEEARGLLNLWRHFYARSKS